MFPMAKVHPQRKRRSSHRVQENQRNKETALRLWQALDSDPAQALSLLSDVTHWQGPEPVGICASGADIVERLFAPLRRAIPGLKRQTHLFMGGQSSAHESGPPKTRAFA